MWIGACNPPDSRLSNVVVRLNLNLIPNLARRANELTLFSVPSFFIMLLYAPFFGGAASHIWLPGLVADLARCVAKFFQVNKKIGLLMNEMGAQAQQQRSVQMQM